MPETKYDKLINCMNWIAIEVPLMTQNESWIVCNPVFARSNFEFRITFLFINYKNETNYLGNHSMLLYNTHSFKIGRDDGNIEHGTTTTLAQFKIKLQLHILG